MKEELQPGQEQRRYKKLESRPPLVSPRRALSPTKIEGPHPELTEEFLKHELTELKKGWAGALIPFEELPVTMQRILTIIDEGLVNGELTTDLYSLTIRGYVAGLIDQLNISHSFNSGNSTTNIS